MKKFLEKVDLFHKKFKVGEVPDTYEVLTPKEHKLRYDLMKEENEEYLEACENNDLVEIADALGDQLYILCGTILKHGLHDKIEEVFNEIQESNMSKLDGNGEPIFREDGKILKGENYFRPNIEDILIPDGLYGVRVGDKYAGGELANIQLFDLDGLWCGFQVFCQANKFLQDVKLQYPKEKVSIELIN